METKIKLGLSACLLGQPVRYDGGHKLDRFLTDTLGEAAAALFLDLDQPKKRAQIAEELGISLEQLKNLTRTKTFEEVYDALFAELGHDPRYKAFAAGVADLLPHALRELELLIKTAPPGVKMQAIKFLVETAGVKVKAPDESDERQKLAEFLVGSGITQNVLQVNLGAGMPGTLRST